MGPNPNGPRSVTYDRAIRYSGFFGVRETWVLLVISWIVSFDSMILQWEMIVGFLQLKTCLSLDHLPF